ncbi:MAG: hypothetical protein B6U87_01910 [Candidatus Aenigmarchaeota archaeon ex4484_52]|nr:MAG: hypothetical protein B6U87_01910 [Candidatus Aenigmarchaeota archaeon ex4484_52]
MTENQNCLILGFILKTTIKNQYIYNIITKNKQKKKIIVCAHYDSILNTLCANDNATEISALIELAKTNKNVQYILFSAEKFNKYGSYAYVYKKGVNIFILGYLLMIIAIHRKILDIIQIKPMKILLGMLIRL